MRLCECGCDQPTRVPTNRFVHGHSVSPVKPGDRFGRLVVQFWAGSTKESKLWDCRCDCGKASVVSTNSLTTGNTRSCGCGIATFGSRENNMNWKGDAGSKENGRERARRWFPDGDCEAPGCDRKPERHHKDENPLNNDPSNIAMLCHLHHMRVHYKGVPKPLEMRRKISATLMGRKPTPQARANQSAALREWWKRRKAARCA